jgi:hypothetical protein
LLQCARESRTNPPVLDECLTLSGVRQDFLDCVDHFGQCGAVVAAVGPGRVLRQGPHRVCVLGSGRSLGERATERFVQSHEAVSLGQQIRLEVVVRDDHVVVKAFDQSAAARSTITVAGTSLRICSTSRRDVMCLESSESATSGTSPDK